MTARSLVWAPAGIMAVAALFTVGIDTQRALPLRKPLEAAIPQQIDGYAGDDVAISTDARRVAGVTDYLMRVYEPREVLGGQAAQPTNAADAAEDATVETALAQNGSAETAFDTVPWFSVYIGYYAQQTRGRTIHSPKNCLPGAGWEPLTSRRVDIETPVGTVTVNQYLLQREDDHALVLYWYQGRGRIEANEYVVKWDLLRDAALRGRSEEALVRIMVPMNGNQGRAFQRAATVASVLVPRVYQALPAD